MDRRQLEHVIRASADVAGDPDIVVVGSQAILGSYPNAPGSMLTSTEADVFPLHHPELAADISGAIGEMSPFHDMNDYYAHGVGPETVTAPSGWEGRLVPVREPLRGATGWCLEPHDLVLSKCAAGRENDWAFAEEALRHGLVGLDLLRERAGSMPMDARARAALVADLEGRATKHSGGGTGADRTWRLLG